MTTAHATNAPGPLPEPRHGNLTVNRVLARLRSRFLSIVALGLCASASWAQTGKVELLWLGQSAFRLTTPSGKVHVGGEPVGFIIELENGLKIYHMGDTGLFGDMKLIGDHYKPDVVLIPIGGNFTMDAAFATREWLKPRMVLPMRYGINPLAKGTAEQFREALGDTPVKLQVLKPGEKLEL